MDNIRFLISYETITSHVQDTDTSTNENEFFQANKAFNLQVIQCTLYANIFPVPGQQYVGR